LVAPPARFLSWFISVDDCIDGGGILPMLQVSTLCRAAGRIIPRHNPVGNNTDK